MLRHNLIIAAAVLALSACSTTGINRLQTEKMSVSPSLRVMTFNIQSGRKGIDKVAALIREANPDVVALQEVDRFTARAGGKDQLAALSELTGMAYSAFFKTTSFYGGDYGIAILSKYPLSDAEQRGLPTELSEPRAVGRALVHGPNGELNVYVTHLSNLPTRSLLRVQQTHTILNWMASDSHARVLMGDFNDGEGSGPVKAVGAVMPEAFAVAGHGPSATFPFPIIPDARLDYVFASAELHATDAHVIRKVASDHYPMVVEFAQGALTATAK
ncbi:MAG: endonuclease/exonuclease/phosphatase family protein [Myxococcaceae bacterium]